MEWLSTKTKLPENNKKTKEDCERILTFSPVYPVGDVMRFRVMDPKFLHLCKEVTHWCQLKAPMDDYEEIGDPLPKSDKEVQHERTGSHKTGRSHHQFGYR